MEDEKLPELFFEEFFDGKSVYFRRGRCKGFYVDKVGQNSKCIALGPKHEHTCGIKANKGKAR